MRLSRGMTEKNNAAKIPFGGGKAIIFADHPKSQAILCALADFLNLLEGAYYSAEDIGITLEDIQFVGQLAKFSLNIRSTRRHNFRRLSSGGQFGRNKVIMRVAWERWKAGVFHMGRHVDLCFLGRNSRE